MRNVDVTVEIFEFCCSHCQSQWNARYRVHRMVDLDGVERVWYENDNGPCAAPIASVCPDCACPRVQLVPGHDVAHMALPSVPPTLPVQPGSAW